jgi:PAS domain S-box-containing protein
VTIQQTDKVKYHDLLLQHISDAVIFINAQFGVTGWNTAAEKVYGFDGKVAPGQIITTISGIAGTPLQQAVENTACTGIHTCLEEYFDDFTGLWLQVDIHPLPDGYFILTKDISAKKETELALKRSEENYRLLIEQASDAIYVFTREWQLIHANSSACAMTGYSLEELMKIKMLDLVSPDDLEQNPHRLAQLVPGIKVATERKLRRKDGSTFYGESITQLMPDGRIVSFTRDTTERKKAELALLESEKKYRLLFHKSPLPMFVMEMQTYRFLDVNEAVIKHYGYSREELLRMNAQDIRPAEDMEKFYHKVGTLSDGLFSMGYFRHIKKGGIIIDVEIFVHDFIYQGQASRLVLSIDVTEKLKNQRQLLDTTEQLRALSAHLQNIREDERKHIAREIHDELGQQLTILKLDIGWLKKQLAHYEDTSLVQRTEESLKMLNDTIKIVRRIATELRPSMLDDLGLLPAMQWQSREFENRVNIKVRFESNVSSLCLPPAVATSLFRIYQESLTNIARHAQARNITAQLRVENNHVKLLVSDDGCGFEAKMPGEKNTLGLLGMKERALMIGGRFEINSWPGKGTTIQVTVPLLSNDTLPR